MDYGVTIFYFKANGDQDEKTISRKSVSSLKKAIINFNDKYEIYNIPYITNNLSNDEEFNDFLGGFGW